MSPLSRTILCVLVLLFSLVPPALALRVRQEDNRSGVNYSSDAQTFQYYALMETTEDFPSVITTVRFNEEESEFGINYGDDFGPLVATAELRAMQYQNGWDQLEVRLEPSFYRAATDENGRMEIAYEAAGMAEGFATFAQMEAHLSNLWDGPQGLSHLANITAVQDWVEGQIDFLFELLQDPASGEYGKQLYRLMCIVDGMSVGYNVRQQTETVWTPRGSKQSFSARVAGGKAGRSAFGEFSGNDDNAPRLLNYMLLYMMNAQTEVGDIVKAVHLQRKVKPHQTAKAAAAALKDLTRRFPNHLEDLHCSALVKVVPDVDLFISHVTWNSYESMTRQHKTYVLEDAPVEEEANSSTDSNATATSQRAQRDAKTVLRKTVTMSSYPGLISSLDDWYQTHQRLVVTETTFGVYNSSLFEAYLQPRSVPTFLRTMIANCLSSSLPSSWFDIFGKHNSGTYNNQWMVLNMGALTSRPHKTAPLPPNTFWVGEQLPAQAPPAPEDGSIYNDVSYGVTAADLSAHLSTAGYWASYNLPYFANVYASSGTAAQRTAFGRLYSFNETPRARIFAREQANVRTLADMMQLMRQNNFQTDRESLIPNCTGTPFGSCDPAYSAFLAVASRGDLNPAGGPERYGPSYPSLGRRNHGATDAKITSWVSMMDARKETSKDDDEVYVSYVVNAPTTSGGTLPQFRWRSGLYTPMPPVWGLPTYQRDVFVRMTSPAPPRAAGRSVNRHHSGGYVVAAVCGLVLVVAVVCVVRKARQARQYAVPRGERGESAERLLA